MYWWGFIEKIERWCCSWDVLGIGIVLQHFNLFIIYYLLVRFHWEKWKMVLQLGCAWNRNSFAILQKNQDKRPSPATPTPIHLSPKTLSERLKRICLNMSNKFDVDLFHKEFWKHFYPSSSSQMWVGCATNLSPTWGISGRVQLALLTSLPVVTNCFPNSQSRVQCKLILFVNSCHLPAKVKFWRCKSRVMN